MLIYHYIFWEQIIVSLYGDEWPRELAGRLNWRVDVSQRDCRHAMAESQETDFKIKTEAEISWTENKDFKDLFDL